MNNAQGFKTLLKREILRFLYLPNQTLFPSAIVTTLYILIFGYFLGSRVSPISNTPYIVFIFPGLLMMGVINGAFLNSTTTLFISRWEHFIDDLLVAPISYFQMVLAFILSSITRSMLTASMEIIIGLLLVGVPIVHPFYLLISILSCSFVFASAGVVAGLCAHRWDHIAVFQNYLITPLLFLGGVFFSLDHIPSNFQFLIKLNPIFYMLNCVRLSFLGFGDAPFGTSLLVTLLFGIALLLTALYLFKKGYNLRS